MDRLEVLTMNDKELSERESQLPGRRKKKLESLDEKRLPGKELGVSVSGSWLEEYDATPDHLRHSWRTETADDHSKEFPCLRRDDEQGR